MKYALINKMTAKSGKRNDVLQILLASGAAFNDNEHCQLYVVSKDRNDENVLWIQDVWTDKKSHQAAMDDPVMQEYVTKSIPLLAGMPEQMEVELVGGKSDFIN